MLLYHKREDIRQQIEQLKCQTSVEESNLKRGESRIELVKNEQIQLK